MDAENVEAAIGFRGSAQVRVDASNIDIVGTRVRRPACRRCGASR